MFSLFHLIFQLLKIAVLSWIYGRIIFSICTRIAQKAPASWLGRFTNDTKKSRSKVRWTVYGLLFFYSFTYWGDHGLGDHARIPLGNFKEVQETDGVWAYIENGKSDHLGITGFTYNDNYLYAETEGENATGSYVVWNLKTDEFTEYDTEEEYRAANVKYPPTADFKNFYYHYHEHWGKRFLFLP